MKSEKNNLNGLQGSPELRSRLPRGTIARLAYKYKVSWIWIFKVVSGQQIGDPVILEDAIRIAEVEDENRKRLAEVW